MVDSQTRFGFLRVLDAQVVSLLSAEFLASKDRGRHHMLKDL